MKVRSLWSALIWLLAAGIACADEPPEWSAEFKVGPFRPDTDEWSRYYPDAPTYLELGGAWKPARQLELAVNAGVLQVEGKGLAPLHGTIAGRVDYELYPLHLALLWRGVFVEEQLVVPYAGGGWTRIYYRQKVEHQSDVTGSADGYHVRGGLQLLLDKVDPTGADKLRGGFGVQHTYFFLEHQRTDVTRNGVQLGGSATMAGFLFEF